MRLQVVVLSVLAAAAAAAAAAVQSATSNRSHTKRSITRTLESASPISPTPRARRTRSSLYTATATTTGTTTVSPNSVSTEAARQGARGHIRASDTDLVSVQHWPARPEESTTVPSGQDSYRTAQRRGWEDDLQETIRPKPREEKRYWPKPTQVAEIPNPTEDPPGDWSERVGVGDEETDSVQERAPKTKDSEPPKSRKSLEDRKDWTVTVRTPSPSELAELNNFAARLTHQLEQEAKEHIKLQHEQNLRHQQHQQMQRTQQELEHRLKEAQALQQTLAEEEQQRQQQQQQQRQQQQPRLTLGQLVEVEVVDATGEDDENAGRRWGDHEDHEQEVHIVKVPVPQPVPVAVPQPVPVAVPHPVPVRVKVAEHIEVPVVRTVAVPVETPVPVKIEHLVPYPIEKPVPVPVEKHIPFPIHEPYPVKVPVLKTIHHYIKKVTKTKKGKGKGHHHDRRRHHRHHQNRRRPRQDRRARVMRHRQRMRKMRRPMPSD